MNLPCGVDSNQNCGNLPSERTSKSLIYPTGALLGYINDSRNKTIVLDKKKSKIVKEIFDIYAQGNSRLEDISNYLQAHGVNSKTGKRIHISKASFILSNPFYYGHFIYAGEIYEGKHQSIVSKNGLIIYLIVSTGRKKTSKTHRLLLFKNPKIKYPTLKPSSSDYSIVT